MMAGTKPVAPRGSTSGRTLPAFLVLLSALLLALAAPAEAQVFDGEWCGRSDQDREISFTVAGTSVVEATFAASASSPGCSSTTSVSGSFLAPILDDSFTISISIFGTVLILRGTFESPEASSGTVTVVDATCDVTVVAAWSALPGPCSALIRVDPPRRNFGEVAVGTSAATRKVTLINEGTGDFTVSPPIRIVGDDASDFTLPFAQDRCRFETLGPDESCQFRVGFEPTSTGPLSARALIESPDPDVGDVEVSLLGTGVPAPKSLGADVLRRSFGEVPVATAAPLRKVVLTNHGTGDVRLAPILVRGADRGQFTLPEDDDGCSTRTLQPGASCRFRVGFEPTAVGARRALAVIESNDPDAAEIRVQLRGTGVTLAPVSSTASTRGTVAQRDLVLINAEVLTMDAYGTIASALRIRDGRLVAVGDDVGPLAGAEVIDLGGRTVIPGLVGSGDEWPAGDAGAWRTAYTLGFTSMATRSSQGPWVRLHRRFPGAADRSVADGPPSGDSPTSPWPAIRTGVAEGMERLETLRLFTRAGEADSGAIEVGRRADLVVLSHDYLAVPDDEIGTLSSVLTVSGGVVVFDDLADR